jgi:hypothetical protein
MWKSPWPRRQKPLLMRPIFNNSPHIFFISLMMGSSITVFLILLVALRFFHVSIPSQHIKMSHDTNTKTITTFIRNIDKCYQRVSITIWPITHHHVKNNNISLNLMQRKCRIALPKGWTRIYDFFPVSFLRIPFRASLSPVPHLTPSWPYASIKSTTISKYAFKVIQIGIRSYLHL